MEKKVGIIESLKGVFKKKKENEKKRFGMSEETLKQIMAEVIKKGIERGSETGKKGFGVVMFSGHKSEEACLSFMEKLFKNGDPTAIYVISKTEDIAGARNLIGRFKARWDGWTSGEDTTVRGKSERLSFIPIYRSTFNNGQKK